MAELRAEGSGGAADSLTVDLDAWPLSLDPYHVVDFNQALVLDTLVDPLTRDDRHDAYYPDRTVPSALSGLDALDDEDRTWLLRPAPGQTWGDGTPVRPEELAAGVHRAWGPTCLPLPAAYDTEGTGSPVTTRIVTGPDGAEAIELCSALPLPYLPSLLAFPGAAPVREIGDGWTASGPYRPVRADREHGRIELCRKPSRRTGPKTPERLVFQVHDRRADALAAYAAGQLDLVVNTGLTPDEFTAAAALPDATTHPLAMVCQLWIRPGLDTPLTTPAGRHAFGTGFDRVAAGTRLQGAVLPLSRYSELWEPAADWIEATEATVAPTGPLPARDHRAELSLTYADFAPNGEAAALVAAELQSRFGHRVRLRPLPYARFARAAATFDYELLYCINPAPLAHPAGYLTQFHSTAATGRALGLAEPAVDAALDRALRAPGAKESAPAWREAETAVLAHAPVVPLFQVNSVVLARSGFGPAVAATGTVQLDALTRTAVPDHDHRRAETA